MVRRAREAAAPLYLLLCLLLGGSVQGIWVNLLLQLLGIGLLAWAALTRPVEPLDRTQKQLMVIILLGLIIILLQLVPLPPAAWEKLGGRQPIAEGFRLLGMPSPWQALSLAPYDTFATMFVLIPPLALLAAMWRLGTRKSWLILALLAATVAGILLGALQVGSTDPANSRWYFYPFSNFGVATGFFANANHMAILLVISLPFLTALLASLRSGARNVQRESAAIAMVAGTAPVIVVGLALNGSLAGYGLAVPVVVASAVLLVPRKSAARLWIAIASGALLIAAVAALALSPVGGSGLRSGGATSVQSRQAIMKTSAAAAADFMPFGSGVGTFERVYQLYEDHDRLDLTARVNHAHDEYLELALETGIPGLVVLLLFLTWWARASWRVWTTPDADPYARAAVIASAAILIHSLVDFPLRTAAISACFAMCLGLMAQQRRKRAASKDGSTLWPTRHVAID